MSNACARRSTPHRTSGRWHLNLAGPASLAAVLLAAVPARGVLPTVRLETVSTGELISPVGATSSNDGTNRLFMLDQRGKIQIVDNGQVNPTPFLDIGSKLVTQRPGFDERGLLGMAFHPDYGVPNSPGHGKFYVYYSAPDPGAPGTTDNPIDCRSVVAEYRVDPNNPNLADPTSERILFTQTKPQFNHNAGQLAFGPDRMLYIGIGDGGGAGDRNAGHTGGPATSGNLGNAQDKTRLLGKILRIDVNGNNSSNGQYGIPADNPFVSRMDGTRHEIYATGQRNPWRFSFDLGPNGVGNGPGQGTGRLFVADVGQGSYEEVNIVTSGGNYGWRAREGFHEFDPTTPNPDGDTYLDPLIEYTHPGTPGGIGLSVTGGFVYRGSEFPELTGKYIFGDWSNVFAIDRNNPDHGGTLLGMEEVSPGNWQMSVLNYLGQDPNFPGRLSGLYINSFAQDELGNIYIVARSRLDPGPDAVSGLPSGVLLKIVPVPEPGSLVLLCTALLSLRRRGRSAGDAFRTVNPRGECACSLIPA